MDSDEADEFSIDEAENIRRNIVFHDGKLNDILAEVKTKIPSLDFDDDTHHDNDDRTQLHFQISDEKPTSVCKNRPTTVVDNDGSLFSAEETLRVLPDNVQLDNTHSEEADANLISQTFNSQNPNVKKSSNGYRTGDNSIKLDFNKLSDIDFNKVETTLDHFATNSETSSSAYDMDACEGKLPGCQDEIILMERLSDLSIDQLNSCCSIVEKRDRDVHVLHLDKGNGRPYQKIQAHSHCGSVSTKAIHSWTQIGSDQALTEQPSTIFLDLRPEMPTEEEMTLKKHTTSIQRILGLDNRRSASDSEDDSDNELEDWHEMRNKYKETVFKLSKECREKSAETDRKMEEKSRSQQLTSKRSEKSTLEEVCTEELIGGLPSDDETYIAAKSKIQCDETSSCGVSTTATLLADPKAAENMRNGKHTNDLGSSFDKEEEMVKEPDASGKRQMQHGKKKVTFFQAKELNSQERELTDYSKKGVGHEKQNVSITVLSQLQLNDNDLPIPSDELICLLDRNAAVHVEDKMMQVEDSLETCDTQLQNDTIATKKNYTSITSSYSVTDSDEQTSEFKHDKEINNRRSGTDSSSPGLFKTKADTCSENEKEAYEESTAVKETEDDYFETKNCGSRSQLKQRTTKERKKLKEKIRKKIESMRSTVSANGKYPAAFNTPIIYDQEASYEKEYHSLLPGLEDQLSLLLIVTLPGRGEMNVQRSKGKAFGTGAEINCYFALIAWFLSLGGAYNSDIFVPFSIIGMQQVCQNGKLQLFVGVQPNETVYYAAGKGVKNKTKAFNRAISKYLSTHSVRSVFQNMEKICLGGNYPVDENLYNSKMLSSCITVGQDPNAVQRVFESKPSFFWETLEIVDTNEVYPDSSRRDFTAENTIVLLQPSLYHSPSCVLDLLCRIEDEGCDLAGLRLAYSETSETTDATIFLSHGEHEIVQSREYLGPQHTLALAVRGPSAISKMKSIIGSKHPSLDPRDVPSLRSLYCSTTGMSEDKLFYCPSYSNQAAVNLARWFGGRVSEIELTAEDQDECKVKSDSYLSDGVLVQRPPALLVSSTQAAFYLIISPLVPPSFLGHVLHTCNVRGFSLRGIRRMHIYKRQANNFGLSQHQHAAFCPLSHPSSHFQSPNESPPESPARGKVTFSFDSALVSSRLGSVYPSTLVVLQKENGIYHSTTLIKQLSESLARSKNANLNDLPHFEGNPWRLYFCIMQFNESNSKSLWGDVCYSPDTTMLNRARCHGFLSNPEDEQVCVLCAVTEEAVQYIGLVLTILYSESNPVAGNWELLAIKSFPSLSLIQAREVSPIEVGEQSWESSVKRLMSSVVFACVLRGVNIIQRLREFMASLANISSNKDVGVQHDLEWWLSQTSEVAFRQITVLFEEKELFPDEKNRLNMKYVPPLREKVLHKSKSIASKVVLHKKQRRRFQKQVECKNNVTDDSSTSVETIQYRDLPIMKSLLAGPRPITTVALIKPSCLSKTKSLGKIFKSICQENFGIVALRMGVLTRHEAEVLVHSEEADVNENVKYITSGASLLMCLQRENAVKKLLDILGPEDPVIARRLDPFLLRGCYGADAIHNSMHGSESYSAAQCEMRILFPCGLCCDSTVDLEAEQIPCRAYDETIGKNSERKLTKRSVQPTGIEQSLGSSLVQINCLVLTHHIVCGRFGRKRIVLVDVLECFLSSNFTPVGMKMALLSEEQIDNCLNVISSKSEEKQKLRNKLKEGPCIVIALQRDNAITCFDTILESAQAKCRSLGDYQKHIIRGSTEKEARNLLLYFFDGLVPNCVEAISAV